ncbi:MAG: hypothetical protein EXS47_02535 [Candidatus Zambryskibacteria bacterium]|nr:hypothetical protein [Candidatus Zambryskibacteria bacterium]
MLIQALQKVYGKMSYVILTVVVSLAVFTIFVWLPNIRLIVDVFTSTDVSFVSKVKLPVSLLGSITTNFTFLSATYTLLIAILFGIYISITTYFLKHRIKEVGQSGVGVGFLGFMSGILGVGCAACGSFILTSVILFGGAGVLTFLPLGGSEFGIVGVMLIAIAIYMTAKKIKDPLVCKI